jgi:alpha-glucosidase
MTGITRGMLRFAATAAFVGGVPHATAFAQQVAPAAPGSNPAASVPITARRDGMDVRIAAGVMRVTALTDGILRVRIARGGAFAEDASWAVPAAVRARSVAVTPAANGFATASIRVRVTEGGGLVVEDLAGKVISADAPHAVDLDASGFTLRKTLPFGQHIYGLGDKTGDLDRRGGSFVDWNTDSYKFGRSTDPIYKSIPFFISAGGEGGSYGVLFDNSYRAWFDFAHRTADTLEFGAPDGPIDYYLIAGPTTGEVVRRYTDLTGKAPMPPQWALGFQQSRYSYASADEVRQIAARLRADKIPTDVLWLDIDFQDRNRPFTVNTQTFPDLAGLARDMKADGIKLVVITDLHIAAAPNQNYTPYDTGTAGNHFVHNPDGSVFVGEVWPGPSVFPDFTRAQSRAWWGGLFKPFVRDGIAGFWNDMNEPSVFKTTTGTMPLDTVHHIASDDFADRQASHAEVHNVYGMLNTRATFDGLRTLQPDERPFVMTRASYAGGQRYGVTWTGDNSSTWDHLKLSVHQLINLGLSGFAWGGADVGGFTGGPSADLLTRWFEIGAFTPVFRDHAEKGSPRAEPWVDGPEHLAIRRRFVEERYRLMPYLYALADRNARAGDPVMRPVFYDYPDALKASCDQSMAFTVGASLLVAPPPKPESPQTYNVCLPAGGWFDYWTGLPATPMKATGDAPIMSATQTTPEQRINGDMVAETPRLDRLPVYVRAGTILPRQAVVQNLGQTPEGPLTLDVYPGAGCSGVLYADDGHSMAFQRGVFLRQTVRCSVSPDGVSLLFDKREGRFAPWWKQIAVTVHGWRGAGSVRQGGRTLATTTDDTSQVLRFTMADMGRAGEVTIARR